MTFFPKIAKCGFATALPHHPHDHHPTPLSAFAAAVTTRGSVWFAAAGLATAAILLAPPNELDNLDCQSYCSRVVLDGSEAPPQQWHMHH